MGDHWNSCLILSGKINLPILLESYIKRGKELKVAYRILGEVPKLPQNKQPDLYLLESLYSSLRIAIFHHFTSFLQLEGE